MESNDTTFSHSEFILGSQVVKSYGYTMFGKVKHCFPYSIPIQTQLDTQSNFKIRLFMLNGV